MPLVLITDANVWIDLQVGEILAEAVKLDFDLVLPDMIHTELEGRQQAMFNDLSLLLELGHIRLGDLDGDGVALAFTLGEKYPAPQRPDMFALAIAVIEEAILVTGDRDLCEAAEAEDVEVHGTLWLLDAMVENEILAGDQAAAALQQMLDNDRRLPEKECRNRMRRWSQK